jgi:hypothetical protein
MFADTAADAATAEAFTPAERRAVVRRPFDRGPVIDRAIPNAQCGALSKVSGLRAHSCWRSALVTPRRNLDLVAVQDHERVGATSLWIGRCGGREWQRMVRSHRLVAELRWSGRWRPPARVVGRDVFV